jgi:hypothetical protein
MLQWMSSFHSSDCVSSAFKVRIFLSCVHLMVSEVTGVH